jgi:two-component system OmpR family response regulator
VALTPRERAVLRALSGARGAVLSRGALAAAAGLHDLSVRRVDALVSGLRRELGPGAIVTVRGRGWRLAEPADSGTTTDAARA